MCYVKLSFYFLCLSQFVNNSDSIWARVIKAIHGVEAGLELKGCNCNGVWSSIISSYAMLHGCYILSINSLSRKVGNGSSIRFWKDNWNGNGPLMSRFNRLYHLDVNADCLLSDRRNNEAWVWNWKRQVLGSRNEASLALLVSELGQVQFLNSPDSWNWKLEDTGTFTVQGTRIYIDA